MRVLITGAGGQVGRELAGSFPGHEVVAATHGQLDVADRDAVLQAFTTIAPGAVVHAAAWTDVDACERDPDRAMQVNALGTRHVAEGARLVGAHLCYLSSDYVFAGDAGAGAGYAEWDDPDPRSVYGRSKLAGEREAGDGSTVVRTSWVAGRHGRNFVRTILAAATTAAGGGGGQAIPVVDDQRGCPTFAGDLAAMVARLVISRRPGTYHVTNQGVTTWFGLAREALALAGLDPELVRPVAAADLQPPRPAPRPACSVLDNAALRLSGLPLLPHYREPLERFVKELSAR